MYTGPCAHVYSGMHVWVMCRHTCVYTVMCVDGHVFLCVWDVLVNMGYRAMCLNENMCIWGVCI